MEIWRPAPGYEGLYSVSSEGRVRSEARLDPLGRRVPERVLRPAPDGGGYLTVALCWDGVARTRKVHALVAEAFIGPRPEGMEVCHGNGIRTDNRVENLRYGTREENQADRVAHGTDTRGEKHVNAKLTEADVREIRTRYAAGGVSQAALAHEYSVARSLISEVVRRKCWAHI